MDLKITDRILSLDIARGLSVLGMVVVHTLIMYANVEVQESVFGYIIFFIGKGTPVFMLLMGVSFAFSRRNTLKNAIPRGLKLMATGYLLNALKFLIPILVFNSLPDVFIQDFGLTPGDNQNLLFFLLLGDILQMAGIVWIVMGILRTISFNKWLPFIMALLVTCFSPLLWGFRIGIPGLDYVLDLLWGAEYNVFFPVFPWATFPLIGMFFGIWLKESNNPVYVFRQMLIIGLVFFVAGGILCLIDSDYHFGDFYRTRQGGMIFYTGFNLLLLWATHILSHFIQSGKLLSLFNYCSRHVTQIYMLQWIVIYWGLDLFGFQQNNTLLTILLMGVMMFLTLGSSWIINTCLRLLNNQKTTHSKISA